MDEHWHQLLKQKWNGIVLQPRQRRKYLHTPLWLQLFQRAAAVQDQLVPHQGEIDCTEITTPMINSCPTRWRTSAASATTRRGASSYPASPPTRWTGCLASSATAWWTSLRGEHINRKKVNVFAISVDPGILWSTAPFSSLHVSTHHLAFPWVCKYQEHCLEPVCPTSPCVHTGCKIMVCWRFLCCAKHCMLCTITML